MTGCCAPGRGGTTDDGAVSSQVTSSRAADDRSMVAIPGGQFSMGADGSVAYDADGEGPIHTVELKAYRIGSKCVTNDEFAAFVDDTGHLTEAERYGWSFVFASLLPDDFEPTRAVAQTPWWRQVYGAEWRRPEGPQSDLTERGNHPVAHISWIHLEPAIRRHDHLEHGHLRIRQSHHRKRRQREHHQHRLTRNRSTRPSANPGFQTPLGGTVNPGFVSGCGLGSDLE